MKKILVVFGTRPEAIKLSPVIQQLKRKPADFQVKICVTAQHREMLDQVLKIFKIVPDYDLNIMKPGQDLFEVTGSCLAGIKKVLKKEKPHLVIVQGDTATAFIVALAAFYFKVPIAHVEAGLRTHNKYSPFPEEVNRRLISVLADYHFAPTESSRCNLLREGVSVSKIWVTGNTVVDALLSIKDKHRGRVNKTAWIKYFKKHYNLNLQEDRKIILVTGHRRESFGEGFRNICFALKEIAGRRKDAVIIYPVHLNPHVQLPVKNILGSIKNIRLIRPLEYEPFVFLMQSAYLILTDSGGIQEEAPSLGKPVLVMRQVTERPEGVKAGMVKLVGTDKNLIVKETLRYLENKVLYKRAVNSANPYGNGKASAKIREILSRTPAPGVGLQAAV
ncbi:MAG: UDP-N-acetylglucosamine 2-epimerase (non-hydrolyzing) [Candidatus Omnitrophica bacterium]|nr:UDP-N-acetylglucosamine 2-epimerase (non-hydrolyzing) [Candidatus Omnitrophota bacterium]